MEKKQFYSQRVAGNSPKKLNMSIEALRKLFLSTYNNFDNQCYFQEYFGFDCVDAGFTAGKAGHDIESEILLSLHRDNLWPIEEHVDSLTSNDIFDLIEFLFMNVSKPLEGNYHSWNLCGWHYNTFDKKEGEKEFCLNVNRYLCNFGSGYQLSNDGDIVELHSKELERLFNSPLKAADSSTNQEKIEFAIKKFRRHGSTMLDKKQAVRELADILEEKRPVVKELLTQKDESDLFNIINNFGLRHHNKKQKSEYEKKIAYQWMFHVFLATIYSVLAFEKRA